MGTIAVALALGAILQAGARAQSAAKLELESVAADAGRRVSDRILADLDGDGRQDVLFVCAEPRSFVIVRQKPDGGFGQPVACECPPEVAALAIVDLLPEPGHEVALLSSAGVSILRPGADPAPYARAALLFPEGSAAAPRMWSWGRDLDGDGRDDLLLPGVDEDLLLRSGEGGRPREPLLPVRVPAERRVRRDASGLVALRQRRPRCDFRRLAAGKPLVPLFLDGEGLRALDPLEGGGFGGTPRTVVTFSGGGEGALGLLQRTDVALADLDQDGDDDLAVARTRAEGGKVPELRTELLFFLVGDRPDAKPSQGILAPGVLSSGPDLRDIDGDGKPDLFLSVFAGNLKSEIQRRLIGKVKLAYYLYPGTGASPPFGRSPSLTIEDTLPNALFESWPRRHRVFLSDDWSGDGLADLVRIASSDDDRTHEVSLRLAAKGQPPDPSAEPSAKLSVPAALLGCRTATLGPGVPAIQLDTATGVVFVRRKG